MGIDAFLIKPVSESLIFNTIMEVFKKEEFIVNQCERRVEDREAYAAKLSGSCILLAEDSPLNQQVAVELLEDAGVKVDIAHNGAEAVEKIIQCAQDAYDAVLMDVQMPVMDGFEATAADSGA